MLVIAVLAVTLTGCRAASPPAQPLPPVAATSPQSRTIPTEQPLSVVEPSAGLAVVDYWPSPTGFPADPAPLSTAKLTEGLRPLSRIAAYDAAGGQPRAYLDPTIRGVEITLPIIERRSGWVSVLLPSVNRTVAWIPPGPWITVPLRDQLVVIRPTHELLWFRDGMLVQSWSVSLGIDATPTPGPDVRTRADGTTGIRVRQYRRVRPGRGARLPGPCPARPPRCPHWTAHLVSRRRVGSKHN